MFPSNISILLFVMVIRLLDSIRMCYFIWDRLDENNSIIISDTMLWNLYRGGAKTFVFIVSICSYAKPLFSCVFKCVFVFERNLVFFLRFLMVPTQHLRFHNVFNRFPRKTNVFFYKTCISLRSLLVHMQRLCFHCTFHLFSCNTCVFLCFHAFNHRTYVFFMFAIGWQ